MRTSTGNLWTWQDAGIKPDGICITTNCVVKKDGGLVMGAGVALDAARRYPSLPKAWAIDPQQVAVLKISEELSLVRFPTKYNWKDNSDIKLIEESAKALAQVPLKLVVMPPPGCGLGKLKWEDVEQVISKYLDNRFVVLLSR